MAKSDRIEVELTRDLSLPRFSVKAGFQWEVRKENVTKAGFPLGGGFVQASDFRVLDSRGANLPFGPLADLI